MIWVYAAIEETGQIDRFICQRDNNEWDTSLPRGRQIGCLLDFCKEWQEVSPFFKPQTLHRHNTPRKILSRPIEEMDLLGGSDCDANPLPYVYQVNHKIFQEALIANLRVQPLHVGNADYLDRCYFNPKHIRKIFHWRKMIGPIWKTLVQHDLFLFVRTINIEAFELCKHWAFDIPKEDWRRELPLAFVPSISPRWRHLEGCYWSKTLQERYDGEDREERYHGEDWEPYKITAIDLCEACPNLTNINMRMETHDLMLANELQSPIAGDKGCSLMSLDRLVDTFGFRTLANLPKLKRVAIFWSWPPPNFFGGGWSSWNELGISHLPSPVPLLKQLKSWVESNALNKLDVVLEKLDSIDED